MFDIFVKKKRRPEYDLNVVPVLDMFLCVIFFLLLTTTFLIYNKQTLPPSSVSTITDPVVPPPLAPKIAVVKTGEKLKVVLSWAGLDPGTATGTAAMDDEDALMKATEELVNNFTTKYQGEKTMQIGLGADVPYQSLITVMDAVKEKLPDMVLYSYIEAQVRAKEGR